MIFVSSKTAFTAWLAPKCERVRSLTLGSLLFSRELDASGRLHRHFAPMPFHRNFAARMRHARFDPIPVALRIDRNFGETGRGRANARQRRVEMKQRVRAPRVAIAARGFGHFDGGFQAVFD